MVVLVCVRKSYGIMVQCYQVNFMRNLPIILWCDVKFCKWEKIPIKFNVNVCVDATNNYNNAEQKTLKRNERERERAQRIDTKFTWMWNKYWEMIVSIRIKRMSVAPSEWSTTLCWWQCRRSFEHLKRKIDSCGRKQREMAGIAPNYLPILSPGNTRKKKFKLI